LYAREGAIWKESDFRVLNEDREVIFTTEK
jgi:hypothetical protein